MQKGRCAEEPVPPMHAARTPDGLPRTGGRRRDYLPLTQLFTDRFLDPSLLAGNELVEVIDLIDTHIGGVDRHAQHQVVIHEAQLRSD